MNTFLVLLAVSSSILPSDTIRLSLREAVSQAYEFNAGLRALRADADAVAQGPLEASKAFLPAIQLSATAMRTTDPVAVFGMKLREENFLAQDLTLDALNAPVAYGGMTVGATVRIPVLVPEGLFGLAAAKRGAEASRSAFDRGAEATGFLVAQAYWIAQLAGEEVTALTSALEAVRAHARQAEAMLEQGLVTGLDARLARLRMAEFESKRVTAEARQAGALSKLAMLIGSDARETLVLTDGFEQPYQSACSSTDVPCSPDERSDLRAAQQTAEANRLAYRAAVASNLPSLYAFGAVSRHGNSPLGDPASGDWTVGLGIQWNPFDGLSGLGLVRRTRAERLAADARLEAAVAQARLDVTTATHDLRAAEERLAVVTTAQDDAVLALEQAELRYRTGVAPITELLDVQAASVAARLNLLSAQKDLALSRAALDFAYGVFQP